MESYLSMIFFGDEESISEGARSRQAFRDRVNQTADAEALRGMGVLCPSFFLAERKQSGRTELMPNEAKRI